MAAYSYAPLQPLDGNSAASLQKHEESSLLLGTYAAHSSGLVNGVSLDWSVNGGAADHACDYCRVHEAECSRTSVTTTCERCRELNLECNGPDIAGRSKSFETVDQTLFASAPADGEYEVGQSVTLRSEHNPAQWDRTAHIVKRVIYRPVAVVLDSEYNIPVDIDSVRPYPERWPPGAAGSTHLQHPDLVGANAASPGTGLSQNRQAQSQPHPLQNGGTGPARSTPAAVAAAGENGGVRLDSAGPAAKMEEEES